MWTMWAGDRKTYFSRPMPTRDMAKLCVDEEQLVEVLVQEDPDGRYYGWQDAVRTSDFPSMIWPTAHQLEMCFPNGTKPSVERGEGRVVRLSIQAVGGAK